MRVEVINQLAGCGLVAFAHQFKARWKVEGIDVSGRH
jgi:hypothetical protein